MNPTLEKKLEGNVFYSSDGCHYWTGHIRASNGYARIRFGDKKYTLSRVIFEDKHGIKLDKSILVCHSCDNRLCINPDHLFLGTHYDNYWDMINKGRGENTRILGERNGSSKLTKENVLQMRSLYPNAPLKSIAIQFGVAYNTARLVIKGNTWRHV